MVLISKVFHLKQLSVYILSGCLTFFATLPSYAASPMDTLHEIYNAEPEYLSPKCDISLKDTKFQIAKDLENRNEQIEKAAESFYQDPKNKDLIYEYGPARFRKINNSEIEKDNWIIDYTSTWSDIINTYRKILADNASAEKWAALDYDFRVILRDDQKRVNYRRSFSIKHNDESSLKKIHAEIKTCLGDSNCTQLQLSDSSNSWANQRAYYRNYLKRISSSANTEEFKNLLKEFSKKINLDYEINFKDEPNSHETNKKTSEITVRMDLSAFYPDEQKLARDIESFWSTPEVKIKISTVSNPAYSFFKVVLSNEETRGHVDYEEQTLFINPNARYERFMHEFGHVLGLVDEYFTIWDEEKCRYYDDVNKANIMSDLSGRILDKHIKSLKKLYFNDKQEIR